MGLEFSLANMVWHEFYGSSNEDRDEDGAKMVGEREEHRGMVEKKTKEELMV
jgi:hypothetical protein